MFRKSYSLSVLHIHIWCLDKGRRLPRVQEEEWCQHRGLGLIGIGPKTAVRVWFFIKYATRCAIFSISYIYKSGTSNKPKLIVGPPKHHPIREVRSKQVSMHPRFLVDRIDYLHFIFSKQGDF